MEVSTERKPIGNENQTCSIYTYCRTEVLPKTFSSVWNLHGFWIIYEIVNILKLNADSENLPFDVFLKIDRENEKFIFYIKSSPRLKHCIFNMYLQSVTSNNFYTLSSHYDGEVYSYEVKKSLFMEQLSGFVSRNILRIVVKVCCIESISHNAMSTTTLRDYTVNHYKTDIKNLPLCDSPTVIKFKVNNKRVLINLKALCARSNYFRQYFNNNAHENRTIYVDNVSLDVVKHFKTFVQLDNISFLKYIDVYKLFELFIMAETYEVKDLQTICGQHLKELLLQKMNVFQSEISLDILLFSFLHNIKDLLGFAIDFVAVNIKDHANTKKFSNITQNFPTLHTLLKQAEINISKADYTFERS